MNDNENKLVQVGVVTSAQGVEYPIHLHLGTKWFTAISPSGREIGASSYQGVLEPLTKAVARADAGKKSRVRPEVKLLAVTHEGLVEVTYLGADLARNQVIFENSKGERVETSRIRGFVRSGHQELALRLAEEELNARKAMETAQEKLRTLNVNVDLRVRDVKYLDADDVGEFETTLAKAMQDAKIAL